MHIPLVRHSNSTNPGLVSSNNHKPPVLLFSTIRLNLISIILASLVQFSDNHLESHHLISYNLPRVSIFAQPQQKKNINVKQSRQEKKRKEKHNKI